MPRSRTARFEVASLVFIRVKTAGRLLSPYEVDGRVRMWGNIFKGNDERQNKTFNLQSTFFGSECQSVIRHGSPRAVSLLSEIFPLRNGKKPRISGKDLSWSPCALRR